MSHILTRATSKSGSPGNALACVPPAEADFDLSDLRRFTVVPDHRDIGIVPLRGMVIIYDEAPLHREGFIEGAFYVRESQRPQSLMSWDSWLKREWDERERRAGPSSRLRTAREVVQAVRYRRGEH